LTRTPGSTVPMGRHRVMAAAVFVYLWLAKRSAVGGSPAGLPARREVGVGGWVRAAGGGGGGRLFCRHPLGVRSFGAKATHRKARGLAGEFADTFSRIQEETTHPKQSIGQPNFRVLCEGARKPLDPTIEDEIFRIGREALLNALRHSKAKNIE